MIFLVTIIMYIILTTIQNFLLGTNLSEFHSGYRIYSVNSLKKIPFHFNTNDFHFDTEILIQLLSNKEKIKEISVPTFYGNEICHVNGIKYAFNVLRMTFIAKLQKTINIEFSKKFVSISYPRNYSNFEINKLLNDAMKRK
mgnify:FL=1